MLVGRHRLPDLEGIVVVILCWWRKRNRLVLSQRCARRSPLRGRVLRVERCPRQLQGRRCLGLVCRGPGLGGAIRCASPKTAVVVCPVSAIRLALCQWLFFWRAAILIAVRSLAQAVLAAAIRDSKRPQVIRVSGAARLVAVEVRVLGRGVEGRGEDLSAASAEAWGRFDIAEGATDGLELLLAHLRYRQSSAVLSVG